MSSYSLPVVLVRRITKIGILLALLLFGLERCTTLNIAPPAFLKLHALGDAPILKDLEGTARYAVFYIGDPYQAFITYDPKGDFFLTQGREVQKFDNRGRKTFAFPMTGESELPRASHFIVTREAVYDLSRSQPLPEPVVQVINGDEDRNYGFESWYKIYFDAYARADRVIQADFLPGLHKQPSFMRIDGKWVLFYTSTSNPSLDVDHLRGVTIKGFPPKMDRTILLKDPARGRYAAGIRGPGNDGKSLPEAALNYRPLGQLERLRFDKTYVSEYFAYTPIPALLAGPAWHRLEIGDEEMTFRETGVREIFGPFESRLSWYILPEPYSAKTAVSFLAFRPSNNIDTEGSDGLYIIRPLAGDLD